MPGVCCCRCKESDACATQNNNTPSSIFVFPYYSTTIMSPSPTKRPLLDQTNNNNNNNNHNNAVVHYDDHQENGHLHSGSSLEPLNAAGAGPPPAPPHPNVLSPPRLESPIASGTEDGPAVMGVVERVPKPTLTSQPTSQPTPTTGAFFDLVDQVMAEKKRLKDQQAGKPPAPLSLSQSQHRRESTAPASFDPSRRSTQWRIRENLRSVHLRELTQDMPRKVIRQIRPTRIPWVKRAIKWCKKTWYDTRFPAPPSHHHPYRPGNPKYKFIIHSPYFFLYVISMSLIQAFLSAVSAMEYEVGDGWSVASVVSLAFFILYILEVMLRVSVAVTMVLGGFSHHLE